MSDSRLAAYILRTLKTLKREHEEMETASTRTIILRLELLSNRFKVLSLRPSVGHSIIGDNEVEREQYLLHVLSHTRGDELSGRSTVV